MNVTENPRVPSRFTPPPAGWSYPDLKEKYFELHEFCRSVLMSGHNSLQSAASWERYALNLKTDLDNAMECYRRCSDAHRTTDGQYEVPSFKELNTQIIPTSRLIDTEVE